MATTKFIVNGVEYSDLDDVPAQFRHLFADADRDGVPDLFAAAEGAQGTVTRRVWRGKPEDAPPELRRMIDQAAQAGGRATTQVGTSKVISRHSRPVDARDTGGTRFTSSVEIRGWESTPGDTDALEFRPGTSAILRCWGTAAAAAVISVMILIGDGWHTDPLRIGLHGSLWALALLWFISPAWMRLRLIRDDIHQTVWVRGRRMLFPIRLDFPLGAATLAVRAQYHRHRRNSVDLTGWRWHMLILAEGCKPFAAELGFSSGKDKPRRPPEDVMVLCRQFADTFQAPVDVQVPAGGHQRILPQELVDSPETSPRRKGNGAAAPNPARGVRVPPGPPG